MPQPLLPNTADKKVGSVKLGSFQVEILRWVAVANVGVGPIKSVPIRPAHAEDERHHCSHEPDNSDDNPDIGHAYKLGRYMAVT